MPNRNLLLEALKAGADVVFDPHGAETEPFTTDVEILLGGVPVVTYADGSEQFLDDSVEPFYAYSPRLAAGEMEGFCKANIEKYEAFNAEHGDDKLMAERVPLTPFWQEAGVGEDAALSYVQAALLEEIESANG